MDLSLRKHGFCEFWQLMEFLHREGALDVHMPLFCWCRGYEYRLRTKIQVIALFCARSPLDALKRRATLVTTSQSCYDKKMSLNS